MLQGASGGKIWEIKKKLQHRDPELTTLTGIITKQLTWSYIRILLIIPNYHLYGLDVPVSVQCKRKSAMFHYSYMIFILQIDG